MNGPLTDVRVLDLTRLLPGGYATLLMADMGADVVKIEEPGKGDYIRWTPPVVGEFSSAHIALNRNKRSVSLNLKSERGRDLFLNLAEHFDVVIESFRPGVMNRLGVGWDVLTERNPRLIYAAITGYGQEGPRSQAAGHDVNYIGYAGALSIIGEEGRRPAIPGVQIGDLAGGGMAAVIAILAALHKRSSTGRGSFCDVSMMDGVVSWLTVHAAEFIATGHAPERERMHLSGAYPCYRVYPAADGWLSVGALEPQFWTELCNAIERPDLLDDAFAMGERRDEVIGELEALFETRTRAQWMEVLEGRDVCVGPVNDLAEAFADAQVRSRSMIVDEALADVGPWSHVGNPFKFDDEAAGPLVRLPPPRLGEHTNEVLSEIGVTEAALAELRSAGAV
jgi:crotonobetainyl-CoA:carnitine CoA-transferase CaiB-like acyl-CoA transferase